MNETKSTVKKVLAFVLVLVLITGALFGIDLPYDEVDLGNMITEETTANAPETDEQTETSVITTEAPETDSPNVDETVSETLDDSANEDVDVPAEDDVITEDGGQTDEPQDSTPTDVETDNVVETSADETVADTTEGNNDATEGEVENA